MNDIFDLIERELKERYAGWEGMDQFDGTGDRIRRLIGEMCWSTEDVEKVLEDCFKAVFPDKFNEMLVSGPTSVWTLCPHHLVPCNFRVYIGYIPKGKVLGLSKFSRIAITQGRLPIMQETYTRELARRFWENLEPDGVGIYVVGRHGCIGCRGVTQEVSISTSSLLGSFLEEESTRGEFFHIVGKGS